MAPSLKCPKCGGVLEEGFIFDRDYWGGNSDSFWVAGKPETNYWGMLKSKGKEYYPIQSFRCSSCGYLESYARSNS